MTAPLSDALVFFGATGDLAFKQIFPALQALARHQELEMPIIGVARPGWTADKLKDRMRDSLEQHGGVDPDAFARLCARMNYVEGDYQDPATFTRLKQALGKAQHPLHYLAIPPSMFTSVIQGLARSGCAVGAREQRRIAVNRITQQTLIGRRIAVRRVPRDQFDRLATHGISRFLHSRAE